MQSQNNVLNFGNWILEIIWNLQFVVWNLIFWILFGICYLEFTRLCLCAFVAKIITENTKKDAG